MPNAQHRSICRGVCSFRERLSGSLTNHPDPLSANDRALARAVERFGPPPMLGRQPGFAALIKIILEQQVSLASAEAVFLKLKSAVPEITPEYVIVVSKSVLY